MQACGGFKTEKDSFMSTTTPMDDTSVIVGLLLFAFVPEPRPCEQLRAG